MPIRKNLPYFATDIVLEDGRKIGGEHPCLASAEFDQEDIDSIRQALAIYLEFDNPEWGEIAELDFRAAA